MEERILIQNLKIYPYITPEQGKILLDELVKNDSAELILLPNTEPNYHFLCVLLEKYYTPALTDSATVRGMVSEGPFRFFTVSRHALRAYITYLGKRMDPAAQKPAVSQVFGEDDTFDLLPDDSSPAPAPVAMDPILEFLQRYSPVKIQQELEQQVVGQEDLTRSVADFLYYHALRQRHPELPQRPLLIAGPSGSGKTEVWRVVEKRYGHLFRIQIVDGSNLSCDGWSGNYKLSTFVTQKLANGGILVVDEFDKLVKPKYASGGDNVALQMQSEFLKLLEGEHQVTVNKKQTETDSRKMGFVMVGAFEELRDRKEEKFRKTKAIGFCQNAAEEQQDAGGYDFSDEDFISFGVMPEIVGRIAARCATKPLDDRAYLNIIRSSHSRVAAIEKVLMQYGIRTADVIPPEELRALISKSKSNRTGVRWVSAQVESRLLEAIREQGLFPEHPQAVA